MFALMLLFPVNFLISSGASSTPVQNYQNKQFHFSYKIKHSSVYQHLNIHQGLLHKPHPILFRQIISWKNFIKSRFFWYYFCISKFVKGWGSIKNPSHFHNQLLQFLFLFYFYNQLLQFIFLTINFPISLLLKYLITHLKILLFVFVFNF